MLGAALLPCFFGRELGSPNMRVASLLRLVLCAASGEARMQEGKYGTSNGCSSIVEHRTESIYGASFQSFICSLILKTIFFFGTLIHQTIGLAV